MKKIIDNEKVYKNDNFNLQEYNRYNNEKIDKFKSKYDLSTIEGIKSIPISEAKMYPDGGKSVVYMPEQILNRQATEYKNKEKYDLAIACLKKANELYPISFYSYTRDNYERLVDMLVLAGKYEEAKLEHKCLDKKYGTKLQELQQLQNLSEEKNWESREEYQKRVIEPCICELEDREQYYWLLENLSVIAPKSFGGYRKMKKINSKNYLDIVRKVENTGNKIEKLRFWN